MKKKLFALLMISALLVVMILPLSANAMGSGENDIPKIEEQKQLDPPQEVPGEPGQDEPGQDKPGDDELHPDPEPEPEPEDQFEEPHGDDEEEVESTPKQRKTLPYTGGNSTIYMALGLVLIASGAILFVRKPKLNHES